ncbi:MAG: ribosome recycling factor [Oscillospiraceae bacterium]|jgi:ribosome recycling factor|nr:ribosome recycling factor [Oscillospiraceae bacterium]
MKEILDKAKEKMEKTVDALAHEFSTIRAGRANPSVLDKVHADYYGAPTRIDALATVSVQGGQTLVIQPWDKTALKAVEKAILASDIGITPTNDGTVIRLVFPSPSEERRKELVKHVKKYGEEAKVSIRNSRREADDKLKTLKKNSEITEDDLKDAQKKVDKSTEEFNKKIDSVCAEKEKEIMKVENV